MASRYLLTLISLLTVANTALAADFLSVAEPAVMYDSPSNKGKPLFIIQRHTPVEVVVNLEGWVKVRDSEGSIAWIDRHSLSQTRTVMAITRLQVRQTADPASPLVFEAEKNVALELVEAAPAGWAKVKHRDGQVGYLKVTEVWGL